ncbi:hypothetical protein [Magnetospirillum sp. SS-4]|uniref:hypothetical protein n=1 Tax=Magnetospirillum sp. SS-4 TaxID=2681465 RepID=UPI00137EBADF|nr:hypothetical protein [Magnetospirillum sp. SS-4]CAA7617174.1 membrane hypothetical protein [Magnetospirillum sp. SS-4]
MIAPTPSVLPWLAVGIAGAATTFAAWPWNASGMRLRNGIVALLAVAASLGLWLAGMTDAWGVGAGWYGGFVCLHLAGPRLPSSRPAWLRLFILGLGLAVATMGVTP